MSAENATSSPKIPQRSIYYYDFTSLFHRQMIIHTSYSLEVNLKPFFLQIHTLFLSHLLCSHLTFGSFQCLFFSLYLHTTLPNY